jgi:hypothetical protein
MGDRLIGVLRARPTERSAQLLEERARFLEMVANLVGQVVRLSWNMAEERLHLVRERDRLLREVSRQYGFENIIGSAAPMRCVFEQIRAVAKWTTTVLIRGESGTGQDLVGQFVGGAQDDTHPPSRLEQGVIGGQRRQNFLQAQRCGHVQSGWLGPGEQARQPDCQGQVTL